MPPQTKPTAKDRGASKVFPRSVPGTWVCSEQQCLLMSSASCFLSPSAKHTAVVQYVAAHSQKNLTHGLATRARDRCAESILIAEVSVLWRLNRLSDALEKGNIQQRVGETSTAVLQLTSCLLIAEVCVLRKHPQTVPLTVHTDVQTYSMDDTSTSLRSRD